jgi:hypothetical protein
MINSIQSSHTHTHTNPYKAHSIIINGNTENLASQAEKKKTKMTITTISIQHYTTGLFPSIVKLEKQKKLIIIKTRKEEISLFTQDRIYT